MRTQEDKTLLSSQIAAYDEMRNLLETDYFGKWVVFHQKKLAGAYDSYEEALTDASRRFDHGQYLIRLVGKGPAFIPSIWNPPDNKPSAHIHHAISIGGESASPYDDPDSLQSQVQAYAAMRDRLEAKYLRKWAVFFHSEFQGVFDTQEDAITAAREHFGSAPSFIWRVGLPFNQSTIVHTQLSNANG